MRYFIENGGTQLILAKQHHLSVKDVQGIYPGGCQYDDVLVEGIMLLLNIVMGKEKNIFCRNLEQSSIGLIFYVKIKYVVYPIT